MIYCSTRASLSKKIFIGLLFVLFIFFFSHSEVEACSTCTKEPADLELYFNTMDKLLNVLNTTSLDKTANNQFAADGQELLFATKAAYKSAAMSTLLSVVLVSHTAFLDIAGEIKTLAGSAARRRDRDKFLTYDRKIMMKGLAIGGGDYLGKNVSEEQLQEIDTYLKELQFVELQKDTSGAYTSALKQAKYEDILLLYWHINYLFKKLHQKKWFHNDLDQIGAEYLVVDDVRKKETIEKVEREILQNVRNEVKAMTEKIFLEQQGERRGKTARRLSFNKEYESFVAYIWQIQQDYACAIGTKNECDSSRKQTVAESWENTKGRTSDFQLSMKMFADAWARLKGSLWSKDKDAIRAAQQREEALMESYYGGDVPPERKRFINRYGDTTDSPEGGNPGVRVEGSIEEASSDTQALIKGLQESFKQQDGISSRNKEDPTSYAFAPSNVPQDISQKSANNYPDKDSKQGALEKYTDTESQPTTRWLDQEIALQGVSAEHRSEQQAAAVRTVFSNTFALQQEREKEGLFDDVRSATTLFPLLSAAVTKNKTLRGDKNEPSDQNPGTIYNSAGKVCEMQCSNLQGRCWYYTK